MTNKISNSQLWYAIHNALKNQLKISIDDYSQVVSKLIVYLIADNPNGHINFHKSGLSPHQE